MVVTVGNASFSINNSSAKAVGIKQLESIDNLLEEADMSKSDKEALARIKNKTEQKADRLVTLVELQKEFGVTA